MITVATDPGGYAVLLDDDHRGAARFAVLHGEGEPADLVLSAELVGELVRLAVSDPSRLPQEDARRALGAGG